MREESLFASPQLIELPVRDGQVRVLLRDGVSKVFDELKALSSSELKERSEFGFYTPKVAAFPDLLKRGRAEKPNGQATASGRGR